MEEYSDTNVVRRAKPFQGLRKAVPVIEKLVVGSVYMNYDAKVYSS